MGNIGYSRATALVMSKIAERRAYARADEFMGKCAEALMTKNASDWVALRDAFAAGELEKEAGVKGVARNVLLAAGLLFGGRAAPAVGAGVRAAVREAPVVQQVGNAVKKMAPATVAKTTVAPVQQAVGAVKAPAAISAPRPAVKSPPSGKAIAAATPPPTGPIQAMSAEGGSGKKRALGKLLAALGVGTAAGGGATYAAMRNGQQNDQAAAASAGGLSGMWDKTKQWVVDNPKTFAGLGAATALAGLYALNRN